MIPERITNTISNYNFFVNLYNEIVLNLDLSKESDIRHKRKLDMLLQKQEIGLHGIIEGYNILADRQGLEEIQLTPDIIYSVTEIPSCIFLNKLDTIDKFTIQTYKIE